MNLLSDTEGRVSPVIRGLTALLLLLAGSGGNPALPLDARVQPAQSLPVQTGNPNKAGAQGRSEKLARRLAELYDQQNCRAFFAAFPDTFAEFDQLYGFDEQQGERLLYAKSYSHVTYLFDCAAVSDRAKLNKAISLGLQGRWEADAAALVQAAAYKLVSRYTRATQEILAKLPDYQAASFWYFLFDGPHPADAENVIMVNHLLNRLGSRSKQAKLLRDQYKKLLANKDH